MATTIPLGINLTVLAGTLSRAPELRELPSGDRILTLEVTVRRDEGPNESVPVAWHGAPVSVQRWAAGDAIVVTGRTRRRFFRAGGVTQSRTEVVAVTAVPAHRGAAVRKAIDAALRPVAASVGS